MNGNSSMPKRAHLPVLAREIFGAKIAWQDWDERNDTMKLITLAVLSVLAALAACGDENRPDISTSGLGQNCPAAGCTDGQECVTAAGPGGDTTTCEIRCDADSDCPEGYHCNIPLIVPDSIPNVCVDF